MTLQTAPAGSYESGREDPLILLEPEAWPEEAPAPPRIEVHAGEMVLMSGPAGCGTSRALAALAGLRGTTEGAALVAGRSLWHLPHRRRREALAALRLLHLPHEPALLSNLTVMENMLLPLRYLGEREEGEAAREGLRLLHAAGFGWTSGELPATLPPDARKAVALIRGFLRRPRVALLDDPLGEMEGATVAAVRPLLKEMTATGGCALLAAARQLAPFRGLRARRIDLARNGSDRSSGEMTTS
jgi:putative ABC transport system ATP-binding protein